MKLPQNFLTQSRAELESQIHEVKTLSLSSYQLTELQTSATGTAKLAAAIKDMSRTDRPQGFHCVMLMQSAAEAQSLTELLSADIAHFNHAELEKAQRIAKSLSALDEHKMTLPFGTEQSIEWCAHNSILANTALAQAYAVSSTKLLTDEGKNAITTIDGELAQLQSAKAMRDSAINNAQFNGAALKLKALYFSASSARNLANQVARAGDNNLHWVFVLYVGQEQALKPIKDMFL